MDIEVDISRIQEEVDYLWFQEYYFIITAPVVFSLPPPTRIYQYYTMDCHAYLGCEQGNLSYWFGNGFMAIFVIIRTGLIHYEKGKTQEGALQMNGCGY